MYLYSPAPYPLNVAHFARQGHKNGNKYHHIKECSFRIISNIDRII